MLHRLLALASAGVLSTSAAAFDTVINIPPATSLAGLQSNTQVNVLDGANLSSLVVPSGLTGVEFNVLGGSIDTGFTFGSGTLHISGGFIEFLWNDSDSANQITGGHLRQLYNTGSLDIYGGRIGLLDSDIGEPFRLHGQFFLNGQPVDGPTPIPDGSYLTGVLTDGTPVVFSSTLGDDFRPEGVTIVTAPVPTAVPGVINAPFDPIPYGIRGGKILTLAPGSDTGHDFVSFDSTLNVAGGAVGDDAVVVGGTTLLTAGSIGRRFTAIDGAAVVVSDGSIGPPAGGQLNVTSILRGSSLSVLGGEIPGRVTVGAGSSIHSVGGVVHEIRPLGDSIVRVGGDAQLSSINNTSFFGEIGAGRIDLRIDGGNVEDVFLRSTDFEMLEGVVADASMSVGSVGNIRGGTLENASAGTDGQLFIHGGLILNKLSSGGLVTMIGGQVRDLGAGGIGVLNLEGGLATGSLGTDGGVTNFIGGRVENFSTTPGSAQRNRIEGQGVVNLSGSEVRGGFFVERGSLGSQGSKLNVTGGVFGRNNRSETDASVKLHGAEFRLNGAPVSGPIDPAGDYVLTGTLSDGSVVILSSATSDVFAAGTAELISTTVPVAAAVINAPTDPAPRGLRAGQTLNLGDGVAIGYHFAAVDATLNMTGGSIDYGAELIGSQANLQGGTVGDALLAYAGSTVTIDGATVGDFARVRADATVNLTSGRLGGSSTFDAGSDLVMTGGATGLLTTVHGDAVISGGVVGRRLTMQTGSSLELRGAEFRLNGNPVSGSTTFVTGDVLTGVLSDGTPVLFGAGDSLRTFTITETALPDASPTPIVSPELPTPRGLRVGQSLTLQSGATTVDDFTSLGASIVVDGGQIASRLEANDSRIDLRAGSIGADATLFGDSELLVRGGSVGANTTVRPGATLTQIGGAIGTVTLTAGATLNIAGGNFGGQPDDPVGGDFWSPAGSAVNLFGMSFTQNGVDLLANIGLGESVVVTTKNAALDGVLADGSEFGLLPGGRGRTIGNGAFTLTKLLLGDFNHDGVVNAADYTVWRDSEGQLVAAGTGADHDFDGLITARDSEVWAANYGRTFSAFASLSIPEPGAVGLAVFATLLGGLGRRRPRAYAS